MGLFQKKKEEPSARVMEGFDLEWLDGLPGEEYIDQNPHIRVGAAARIGTRDYQQDTAAIRWIGDSILVAMVCDGMGGLAEGDKASKCAVHSVMSGIDSALEEESLTQDRLFAILKEANRDVQEIGSSDEDSNDVPAASGTTMTLVLIKDDLAVWLSIGDSRIYYLSEKGLQCVTKEHNYELMVEMMKDEEGFFPNDQIRPDSLVSYLGAVEIKYIDYNTVPWKLRSGDMFLLCSDGLTRLLEDQKIESLLLSGEENANALAEVLVEEASSNVVQIQDNTTVVLLTFKE